MTAAADILIVDDNLADLRLLSEVLKGQSFTVRLAGSGHLAWRSIQMSPPDLIILDVKLPDLDGYGLCDRLRADPVTEAIPVIFVSAVAASEEKVRAFERGGLDYITKPYQPRELLARIRLHLENQHLRRQLESQNQQLRRDQARWQLLLQGTGDQVYEWDVRADRATTPLLWIDPNRKQAREELSNYADWLQLIHPDDRDRVKTTFQAYLQHKIPQYDIEYRTHRRDGHYRWIRVRAQGEWDEAGQPIRVVGMRQDINSRKQLERALADALAFHEATFNHSLDALFLVSAETGLIEDCNPRALELFGFADKQAAIGRQGAEFHKHPFTKADKNRLIEHMQKAGNSQLDVEYIRQDGQSFWGAFAMVPLEISGRVMHLVRIADISARVLAETALRESNARFRNLAANIPGAIFRYILHVDGSDRILYMSQGCSELWEIEAAAVERNATALWDMVHPEDLSALRASVRESAQTRQPWRWQWRIVTPSGQLKWLQAAGRPQVQPNGDVIWDTAILDVSDRVAAEMALQHSQTRLERALEAGRIACWEYDLATQELTGTGWLGLDTQPTGEWRLAAEAAFALVHPDDRARVIAEMQEALAAQTIQTAYQTEHRLAGTGRILLNRGKVFRDPEGRPERIVGISLDVTKRRRAETALRESETFLRAVYDGTESSIFIVEVTPAGDFRYLGLNPVHERWTGLSAAAIRGKTPEEILPAKLAAAVRQHYTDCLNCGAPIAYEEFLPLQGRDHWWLTALNPIRDASGRIHRLIGTSSEISTLKQVQAELSAAKEAADTANRAKSAFIANMSHELRTPLNTILGFSELLSQAPELDRDRATQLGIIKHNGEHLLALIDDILSIAKIEAGRMSLHEETLNFYQLLDSLYTMLSLRAQARGIELRIERGPDVPQFVTADTNKLRQVLLNLLNNAIKFTERGTVVLRASWHAEQTPAQLRFAVEDSGCGIASDEIATIFQPFIQARAGRQQSGGTGLGLAISQEFVRLMGGELQVRSQLGRGSTFSFQIPMLPAATGLDMPIRNHSVVGLASDQPAYRILIADDNPDSCQLLTQMLAPIGFVLQTVSDGRQALECYETWQPDLVLADLIMPELDGYTLIRTIRAREEATGRSPLPIVAVTAVAFTTELDRVQAIGSSDLLIKPFTSSQLYEKLGQHLGARYRYRDLEPTDSTADSHRVPDSTHCAALAELFQPTAPVWRDRLHYAALTLNESELRQLLKELPPDSTLVAQLDRLITDFRFDIIIDVLEALDACEAKGELGDFA